ncbi:MAG: DUF1116 domain-containing protein [Escherichia coli]
MNWRRQCAAIAQHGELELKPLMAQALHMGDEVHNRNAAATGLLIKRSAPGIGWPALFHQEHIQRVVAFITGNDHSLPQSVDGCL